MTSGRFAVGLCAGFRSLAKLTTKTGIRSILIRERRPV
jgi:hypothetical protein